MKPFSPQFNNQPRKSPDQIAIVGFGETATVLHNFAAPHSASLQKVALGLKTKANGSGTNIAAALRTANSLLQSMPRHYYRKEWLLSDGEANRSEYDTIPAARAAKESWINVNSVALADCADHALLAKISSTTHNGKTVRLDDLRKLTDVLIGNSRQTMGNGTHRPECCVLLIDLSASMNERCNGKTRIELVSEAVLRLLLYKQQLFS